MVAPAKKLVRIKPSLKCEVRVIAGYHVKKEDGWVEVPAHVAKLCESEVLNELNPEASELVFDVKDVEEARVLHEREKKKVDPAGTPDKPKVAQRSPVAPAKAGKKAQPAEGG